MRIRVTQRNALYIAIAVTLFLAPVILIVASRGVNLLSGAPRQVTPTAGFAVDPLFKEFYDTLGGYEVLGSPLTVVFERDGENCQFTEKVLLCFNPIQTDTARRFHLAPLGLQMDVREDAPLAAYAGSNLPAGSRDLGGGFSLYPEFTALYDRLFGALYVGKPLTQVRANQSTQRYEQFFENAGFYRGFNAEPGQVHLIPYGSYFCGPDCSRQLDEFWMIQQSGLIAQPFEINIRRMGLDAVGQPLSKPVIAADGMLEQAYDNAVLYALPGDLSRLRLRPLVRMLNFVDPQPLVAQQIHEQLVFYEVQDGLGHNVPLFFDRYITANGGRDLSGAPLTEVMILQPDQLFRQCFENYCLDYDALAPEQARVRLVPLGLEYIRQTDPAQMLRRTFSAETVQLTIEEAYPQLTKGQKQRVSVHVLRRQDASPMYLVEGTLTLTYPGRPSETLHFSPTDPSGRSVIEFNVPADLDNLTIVEYRACLNLPSDPRICAVESFIYRSR